MQRGLSDGVHPAVQEWTTTSAIERLRSLLASANLGQLMPSVEPLVMNAERGRAWVALLNAELEELRESSVTATPMDAVEEGVGAPGDGVESMEVAEDAPGDLAGAGRPKLSRLERLRQEAAAKKSAEEPEPGVDLVLGSQSWHSQVPQVIHSIKIPCLCIFKAMLLSVSRNGFP